MTIARFHPMPDVVTLREAMDRLFEDSFIRPTTWTDRGALRQRNARALRAATH